MYEMTKHILEKVSFDKTLFRKELMKARKFLKKDELLLLRLWCLTTFGHLYKDVIQEALDRV